jgi:hypothetical protein
MRMSSGEGGESDYILEMDNRNSGSYKEGTLITFQVSIILASTQNN